MPRVVHFQVSQRRSNEGSEILRRGVWLDVRRPFGNRDQQGWKKRKGEIARPGHRTRRLLLRPGRRSVRIATG